MVLAESPRSLPEAPIPTFDHQSVDERQMLFNRSNAPSVFENIADELKLVGHSNVQTLARPMMEGDKSVQMRLILEEQTQVLSSIDSEGNSSIVFTTQGKGEKLVVVADMDADTGDFVVSLHRSSKEKPGVQRTLLEDEAIDQGIDIVPPRANFSDASVLQKAGENIKLEAQVRFALALAGYSQ